MKKNKDVSTDWVMGTVFLTLMIGAGVISINKSNEGINSAGDVIIVFDETIETDSTKFKQMAGICRSTYAADSLSATADARKKYSNDITSANAEINKNQNILKAKYGTYTWLQKETAKENIKDNKAIVEKANKSIEEEAKQSLDIALSHYNDCIAIAQDTLLSARNSSEIVFNGKKEKHETAKNTMKKSTSLFMYIGVLTVFIAEVVEKFWIFKSGIRIKYKTDPTDYNIPFRKKFKLLNKATRIKLGDWFINRIYPNSTIELGTDEVKIIEKKQATEAKAVVPKRKRRLRFVSGVKSWFGDLIFEDDTAQLEAEQRRLGEEKRAADAKTELEKIRLENAAEIARIKAEAEAQKLRIETETAKNGNTLLLELKKIQEENIRAQQLIFETQQKMAKEQQQAEAKREQELEDFKQQAKAEKQRLIREAEARERQRLIEEQQAKAKFDAAEAERLLQDAEKAKEAKKAAEEAKAKLVSATELFKKAFGIISVETEAETEAEKQAKAELVLSMKSKGNLTAEELKDLMAYAKSVSEYYKRSNKSSSSETTRKTNRIKYEKQKAFLESVGFEVIPNKEGTAAAVKVKK